MIIFGNNSYAAINVFPDPPHNGAAWGLPGVFCLFKPLECGGFLKFCPQIGITGFVHIENHSDYSTGSSDRYKIKVLT